MSSTFVEDGAFVNSIVGEGTRFNGELELNGLLRIDGDFTGSIKTAGKVLVGKNGRAKCTISASTVVIGGAVRGDIYSSEKVIVLSSGIIQGNIFTPRLIVEEGVILDGNCSINTRFGKKEEVSSVKKEEKESNVSGSHDEVLPDRSSLQEGSLKKETPGEEGSSYAGGEHFRKDTASSVHGHSSSHTQHLS